jgi:hypothetical protein
MRWIGMKNLLAHDLGDSWPESVAATGDDSRAVRPRPPAVPRRGIHLLWRIAGFIVVLVLITVASHFIGGAAGRWAGQQWAPEAATSPAPDR